MSEIYNQIYNVLISGIMFEKYTLSFLAVSASQMRDHGCWLYSGIDDTMITASKIRDWMGDFKAIRCIGKFAARLGQSLSSSIETIHTNDFKIIDDVTVRNIDDNNIEYCFTDGIGKISMVKAEEICKKYFNSKYISAFQIRFSNNTNIMKNSLKVNKHTH
jgi:RNA-dependent RNA polymerase